MKQSTEKKKEKKYEFLKVEWADIVNYIIKVCYILLLLYCINVNN